MEELIELYKGDRKVVSSGLAADVARNSEKINELDGKIQSCFIYPNGGTAASPANVTANSRYVQNSPWPGYFVKCEAQIKYNNLWGDAPYSFFPNVGGIGIKASNLDNKVVLQVGQSGFMLDSANDGNPWNTTPVGGPSIPCRIYCEKGGPLPS